MNEVLYARGNAAKQWIFSELHQRFGDKPFRLLDLGCGDTAVWKSFAESHPNMDYQGFDYDIPAIERGKKMYAGMPHMHIQSGDAQKSKGDGYDAVTALSAIEHVVNRKAFLETVFAALKTGQVAYLNYDDGHFRSHNVKERVMVPVSQLLAKLGVEGPYMKHVDDDAFKTLAEQTGFQVQGLHKHNLGQVKGFMRHAPDEAVRAWFNFEEKLGEIYKPKELDRAMWSSTLVVTKP